MLIHASFVQYTQSEVLVLLMRLAEELYFERNDEVLLILDLISRMVTFSTVFFSSFIARVFMDLEKYWLHQLVYFTIYCSRGVVAKKLGGQAFMLYFE